MGLYFYVFIEPKRHNIIILSACSLRRTHLQSYGHKFQVAPALNRFAKEAVIFENSYAAASWSNASYYLNDISKNFAQENNYEGSGLCCSLSFLIRREVFHNPPADFWVFMNRKNNEKGLEYLKEHILKKRKKPFFFTVHVKYMHTPYYKTENKFRDHFLSEDSKKLFSHYLSDPQKFKSKLPLLSVLFRDTTREGASLLSNHALSGSISKDLVDSLSKIKMNLLIKGSSVLQPEYLLTWKKSRNYQKDLQMLEEVYDSLLFGFDKEFEGLLNLYGDKELQKNTVIIFLGDHGDAIMEHDKLLHGGSVYDEAISFPMMIKFPGQKNSIRIKQQFHQASIKKIVEEIMRGQLNEGNVEKFFKNEIKDDIIVSRDCASTMRSVRYKNKWKFIYNFVNDKRELYDLESDPAEKHNVYAQMPEKATDLEEILLDSKLRFNIPLYYPCSKKE